MEPARGSVGRIVRMIDWWITVSVRLSRWPGAWIAIHRLLSLPLLARVPSAEAVVGPGIRIRCLGRPPRFAALLQQDSPGTPGSSRWLAAFVPAGAGDADVEARAVHPWAAGRFRRAGWTLLPEFVRYRAEVAGLAYSRVPKSLASDLRRVDRLGYVVSAASRGRGAWRRFRRRMSEPYARRRFGPGAWLPPALTWSRLRLHGRLLTVRRDGEPVAGGVMVRVRDEVWFAALGVRDGDPALVREGALVATYRAVCDLTRSSGAAVLDGGRCSGRTDDPIGRYKRKWGLRPTPDPLTPLVAVRPTTSAGARWLAALPRYAVTGDGVLAPPAAARDSVMAMDDDRVLASKLFELVGGPASAARRRGPPGPRL